LPAEKAAIIAFHDQNLTEGYRRLTWMMNDLNIVAASPSSVRRVLVQAGRLRRRDISKSRKGKGFEQPLKPHEHWHTDITFVRIGGKYYPLCSFLEVCSRLIVHWEIRETMTEQDVEIVLQRARELFPHARPRIISDNGPQYISKDFKAFLEFCQMTHVRTSPYYPQSNGKIERWHKSLKVECLRPGVPLSLEHARVMMAAYVDYYNNQRLHSAIGYVTPMAMLENRAEAIWAERKRRLENARAARKQHVIESQEPVANEACECENNSTSSEDRATWRHDPSAGGESGTNGGGTMPPCFPFRFGPECEKPTLF
jgi:transposase InsO family protein